MLEELLKTKLRKKTPPELSMAIASAMIGGTVLYMSSDERHNRNAMQRAFNLVNDESIPHHYHVTCKRIQFSKGSIRFMTISDDERLRGLEFSHIWLNEHAVKRSDEL